MLDTVSSQSPARESFNLHSNVYREGSIDTDNDAIAANASEDWYALMGLRPAFASTVTDSLGAFFKSFLPVDQRILGMYWMFEGETLRVWTVIEEAEFALEQPIYDAQMRFIEKMPELECDFSVIYRRGRDIGQLLPTNARAVA